MRRGPLFLTIQKRIRRQSFDFVPFHLALPFCMHERGNYEVHQKRGDRDLAHKIKRCKGSEAELFQTISNGIRYIRLRPQSSWHVTDRWTRLRPTRRAVGYLCVEKYCIEITSSISIGNATASLKVPTLYIIYFLSRISLNISFANGILFH